MDNIAHVWLTLIVFKSSVYIKSEKEIFVTFIWIRWQQWRQKPRQWWPKRSVIVPSCCEQQRRYTVAYRYWQHKGWCYRHLVWHWACRETRRVLSGSRTARVEWHRAVLYIDWRIGLEYVVDSSCDVLEWMQRGSNTPPYCTCLASWTLPTNWVNYELMFALNMMTFLNSYTGITYCHRRWFESKCLGRERSWFRKLSISWSSLFG
jgi:hypothetical protein